MSENEDVFPIDKIDLSSLSLASTSLELKKHMLKCTLKRKYKKDREKLLETKEFLLGLKMMIKNYEEWYTGNNIYDMLTHHKWEEEEVGYDLYTLIDRRKTGFDTTFDVYKNINDNVFYGYKSTNKQVRKNLIPGFENGIEYIITSKNLNNMTNEAYLDKKTINEIAYKLRKNLFKR